MLKLGMRTKYCNSNGINIDDEGEWGTIYDNSSGNGVLGAVGERRADIGFTALYLW